jgi:hypothetical protein
MCEIVNLDYTAPVTPWVELALNFTPEIQPEFGVRIHTLRDDIFESTVFKHLIRQGF